MCISYSAQRAHGLATKLID